MFFFMKIRKKHLYAFFSLLAIPLLFILTKYAILPTASPVSKGELQKKHMCIIVNPISGGGEKEKLLREVQEGIDKNLFDIQIYTTEAPLHATALAKEAVKNKVDIIVVVGGDGSVNEVGQALIGSKTALAIIPTGSGNGISRHLQIPQNVSEAIAVINQGKSKTIDTVCINDRHYLGVAGIGFDAEVSWEFSKFGHRGFISYLLLALKKLPSYRPHKYVLSIDGKEMTQRAFLISFANSSQFGNGAFIAPDAKIDDGFLEAVIIKKFPFYATPQMAHRLFHHSLNHSEYVDIIKCKEVQLNKKNIKAHIDGEPIFFPDGMHLKVNPGSLKVIVP